MPDENQQPLANGGYISADGINWEPVGHIDEHELQVLPEPEITNWTERLHELPKPQTITFKTLWWQDFNPIYRLIGIPRPYRSRYTVPMLRRNGKSHRGCR